MPAPEPAAARLRLAAATLALAVGFFVHARAWVFVCDDAFISFRYARNLARFGALEYNLGERVEGYTNFLWVLVLGLGDRLGVAPEDAAPVLTAVGAAVLVVAATRLLRGLRGRASAAWSVGDLAPAALMIAAPEVMVWSQGGLETSCAAALALLAMDAWLAARPRRAALFAALAGLTRADVLVAVAAFGLAWLALAGVAAARGDRRGDAEGSRLRARAIAEAALVFAALIGGHLIFRRLYYGAWLPNTWTVKAHGALLRGTFGVDYLRAWAENLGLVYAAPLLALARARHLVVAAPIAAAAAYAWSVGGDFMAYSRFLLVATALVAVLVAWLLADAGERLGARWPRLRGAGGVVALAFAAALASGARARWAADRAKPAGWIDGRWEGVTAMDRFARERLHVGAWMREHLPGDTLITVGAAGAMPYTSELPTVDVFGLVDPTIADLPEVRPRTGEGARPGHQLYAPRAYIRARDPDLLCHAGYVGERRPSPALARRRGYAGMVWACVEPGPVADPREPDGVLDLGFYCCLRPRDRAVGPFGAEP
ncbi:MAG: hypothetical protein R3A79_14215 [Nannocystaceae bacterium]